MNKTHLKHLVFLFLMIVLALFLLNAGASHPAAAAATKIMPLGDSITGSPGCWRAILWNRLQDSGYTDIDFVGTLPLQGCGVDYDGDNEGHGGYLATNVAAQNQLVSWLAATNPDIVMMHFGTNDVWSGLPTTTILDAFTTLVTQMRANNPNMKILVAQIIPMDPARSCADCDVRVIALNNAIPGWASSLSTSQSPIVVVDQWTGFDTSTDTYDGVHPNDAGNLKISDGWYPALASFLTPGMATPTDTPQGATPTSTSPVATPPATSTSTPTPPGSCQVAYTQNDWGSGATVNVTITNNSGTAINGWTLAWVFSGNQQITNLWGGSYSQTGTAVSVSNAGYNGSIGANGGTANFGFNLSYSGTNNAPTDFTLNGLSCGGGSGDPTPTTQPPTATAVPPTATTQPPTATAVPPTATSQPPTATAVPPTATPDNGLNYSVDYIINNDWGSGYTANITITNLGSVDICNWALSFTLDNGIIVNGWNGDFTQVGTTVRITPSGWNNRIPANGGSVSVGFQTSYSGSYSIPDTFILTGTTCQ